MDSPRCETVAVTQADCARADAWYRDWRHCEGEHRALLEAFAAHRISALSGVRELVEALEWCREQANGAMAISAGCATTHGDDGGGLEMVNRIASDIAINLEAALSRFQSNGRDLG